jgi:hypothetical protein
VKRERTALAWSLGGTVIPVVAGQYLWTRRGDPGFAALSVAGVLIGPSLGHLYAGRFGRGAATVGLRVALGAGMVAAGICWDECTHAQNQTLAAGAIFFGTLTAVSVVYDIVTAPASARRWNARRAALSMGPARVGGRSALGAWVTVRF